jgi:hypothetical protein
MAFGLGFFVTLAVIVGYRLSSEAMAVMVGVIAGVAASIPTSLIVIWFTTRMASPRLAPDLPTPRPEPRIVVMAQPSADPRGLALSAVAPAAGFQNFAGYPSVGYAAQAYAPTLPARQFTVIGGADVALDEPALSPEVVWQR